MIIEVERKIIEKKILSYNSVQQCCTISKIYFI